MFLHVTALKPYMDSHMHAHKSVCIIKLKYLHKLQASAVVVLQVLVFYFVRCVLAFSCCVCELYFYK